MALSSIHIGLKLTIHVIKIPSRETVPFNPMDLLGPLLCSYLELLGLLDPDLNLGVGAEAGSAQQGNLLLFRKCLGVLGVQNSVVNTLCTQTQIRL